MTTTTETLTPEKLAEAKANFKKDGFVIIPNVISTEKAKEVLDRLWKARDESERRGDPTHLAWLDPNESNVRVFYLMNLDPIFLELIQNPTAIQIVKAALESDNFLISNFTANIARPGSKSMGLHSDLSLQCPAPWEKTWAANVIWCITDIYEENGATMYIPGSHQWKTPDDVISGEEEKKLYKPFEAKAGSIVVMDGRLWHNSGSNVTKDVDRALLFGAYNAPFLRGQVNWAVGLSDEVKATLSPQMRDWLGVNRDGNLGVVTGENDVFKEGKDVPRN
ncbi:hypothetical protein DTO195F2_7264 [Paecilomyces variotii]|nr:hypothetical protein DTO195F2_7264 [Paecilomyces variotii]